MSKPMSIDVHELIAQAKVATGLDDFGDPPLLPALERLAHALNEEAHLSVIGVQARSQHLLRLLINRLKLAERLKQQPERAKALLGTPIVIVGLPRSGTTKMQRALSANRRHNHIAFWEALFPIALSDDEDDRQKRIAGGEAFCNALRANPEFYAAHPVAAEEPEEEMVVMQHSFLTESVDAEVRVPSYVQWLQTQDRRPMYRQLASWMRVLADSHGLASAPWVLKGTYHGAHLDALLDVLPNARIVYCHRDPVETIASYCSLVSKIRAMLSDKVDRHALGSELLAYWSSHLQQTMAVRRKLPAGRVLDIAYRDILQDMPAVLERVYAFADLPLSEQSRNTMLAWVRDNAQNKHGRHEYHAADFGLSNEQIAAARADYRAAFITI